MTATEGELLYSLGLIDESALFHALFSQFALLQTFETEFAKTASKGIDRINGFQFAKRAAGEFVVASEKCLLGQYRFAPYLENLKPKGRNKPPRLIGIPTIRDRVVLRQLNGFLAAVYPDCVPRNVASTYVRAISADLQTKPIVDIWVCGTDIKTFYDDIRHSKLLALLGKGIKCWQAARLIGHALMTPTVPRNVRRKRHHGYRPQKGVPQGLAISNILASIYMQGVDVEMKKCGIAYYRYVDDVLMYGDQSNLQTAIRSLRSRLSHRGLSLHSFESGKSYLQTLTTPFAYLGYVFKWPEITVRDATIERFLQSIAAKFSDFTHNKARRLERIKYLTEKRIAEIFLMELNEKITGAISEKKRYGWVAYFSQITDLSLLHRLDHVIARLFDRLPDFGNAPPPGLRKLARSYFEMKFSPQGGYVRDYDKVITRAQKLAFLEERGRLAPGDALTDEQINDRYEKYRNRILSEMHADEGVLYG